MRCHGPARPAGADGDDRHRRRRHSLTHFWQRWMLANSVISGLFAIGWLVLRSGPKPSRFTYPCQQAALSTAMLAFGAPLVASVIAAQRRVTRWTLSPAGLATVLLGLLLSSALWSYFSRADPYEGPILAPRSDYRAQLYHVTGCPQDPAGDRFVGLDNLLGVMGRSGLKFYASSVVSPVAGPGGIIAADDVVVIKINYQWDQRGGTNVDVLRGLIRRIVDHPDGFVGEVVICENAQFNSVQNFDRSANNAQDHTLSPHDVAVWFAGQGFNVSHFDWTSIRYSPVGEYSAGDMADGYVVYDYDPQLHGRVSYPKFRSDAGSLISLKHGIWDPAGQSYDRERLEFVNLPVLKSHHATYGATAAVKHYMGVVTGELGTNSHSAIHYGIMGALLGEIQLADLNLVDAVWINANPYDGPWTSYAAATRRDELLASVDPVAADIWAVKNILIPAFIGNGYSPPWPAPSADPDDPGSAFRQYLDNSMYQILAAGNDVTNDLGQIDVAEGNGAAGDFDGDGDVDDADYDQFAQCFTGPGGGPPGPGCGAGDFDGDDDIDCDDWELFQVVWTAPGTPPLLPDCATTGVPPGATVPAANALLRAVPNPMHGSARIAYTLGQSGRVGLEIFDVAGRMVRTLVDQTESAGWHAVTWDGRDQRGVRVGRGVYSYRLETATFRGSRKIVVR